MWSKLKEYYSKNLENFFLSEKEFEKLCAEQDAWVEQKNAEQLEEWRKEQALKKRDPSPKTDFDDDVPF